MIMHYFMKSYINRQVEVEVIKNRIDNIKSFENIIPFLKEQGWVTNATLQVDKSAFQDFNVLLVPKERIFNYLENIGFGLIFKRNRDFNKVYIPIGENPQGPKTDLVTGKFVPWYGTIELFYVGDSNQDIEIVERIQGKTIRENKYCRYRFRRKVD